MDSSDGLNVGDVTGPRWAGGTRNPDGAEKVVPWSDLPAYNKALVLASRNAEVATLREQLAAAEAAKADAWDEGAAANWDGQDLRYPNPYRRTGDTNA